MSPLDHQSCHAPLMVVGVSAWQGQEEEFLATPWKKRKLVEGAGICYWMTACHLSIPSWGAFDKFDNESALML
jgi:hypothetical protein